MKIKTFFPLWVLMVFLLITSCTPVQVVDKDKEAEAHFMLGISYLQERDYTRALKEFLVAEDLSPSRVDIQEGMAQAYQAKQAYPEAEKHYLKALEISPNDARIANNLGALYLDMREWDKAIESFQRANANLLFNTPEIALTGIGFAYFRKMDYEKAELYYQKALKKKWNYAPAYFRLGELLQTQGKDELARHSFQKALELSPKWAHPYFHLGTIQMKAKEFEAARESFAKVIELAPETELADKAADLMKVLPDKE